MKRKLFWKIKGIKPFVASRPRRNSLRRIRPVWSDVRSRTHVTTCVRGSLSSAITYRLVRPRRGTNAQYTKYKAAALAMAKGKVSYFNGFYQFNVNRISIKNQKSRWGSCSKKGNLNFNYKIALLPQVMSDYIIVHELCHLGEFNHSPRFWKLVAKTIPNYKIIRKQFKKIPL